MPAALLLLLLHYCYRVTWGHIRIVRKKPHIYGWDRGDVYLVYICVPITNHFWFLLTLMCVSVCVLNGHLHAFIITKSSTCNVCTHTRERQISKVEGCKDACIIIWITTWNIPIENTVTGNIKNLNGHWIDHHPHTHIPDITHLSLIYTSLLVLLFLCKCSVNAIWIMFHLWYHSHIYTSYTS